MPSPRQSLWRHPLLEGLAVLAGILIAFGLEASWQAHTDRETEAAYLSSLRSELAANRKVLQASLTRIDADLERTEGYIILVSATPPATVSQDSLRQMTASMNPLRVTPLQRSAYADLLSGGLQRIQSPDIRRQILAYGQALELDALRQQRNEEWFATRAQLYDELHADLVGMGSSDNGWSGRHDLRFFVDPSDFVGNRQYANILAVRAFWMQTLRQARADLLSSLEALDSSLAIE